MANKEATGRPPTGRSRRVVNLSDTEYAFLRHIGGGERRIGQGVESLLNGALVKGVCPACNEPFSNCEYLGGSEMFGDWIVLGGGFGVQFDSLDLRWIYWAPTQKTQEGLLRWGRDTLGVEPKKRTAIPQPDNLLERLQDAGIVDVLKVKVKNRVGYKN
jgi:hypothetical protein